MIAVLGRHPAGDQRIQPGSIIFRQAVPVADHHRPLASTKLYCLATATHGCERLIRSGYAARLDRESNRRPLAARSSSITLFAK